METALSICYEILIKENEFSWKNLISLMSSNPSTILGQANQQLVSGNWANIAIFDPNLNWNFDEANRISQAINSPFDGRNFTGKIIKTFFKGEEVYGF